jgi:LPXTG-motif cell wall-anchored protein
MFKKIVSGAFAATLVFAVPTMALACNWGAQVSGDCKKLDVTVNIEQGDSEKAGHYDLYWSKDGNPKQGKKIATGDIPALKKGQAHNISYNVTKNENGKEGRYIFHLVEPNGSIWSKEIVVNNCSEAPPSTDDGGTTVPPKPLPTPVEPPTVEPPTAGNGGPTTLPADGKNPTPVQTKPNGGALPKTASSYPTVIVLGAALIAGGALTLRFRAQN